MLAAVKVDRSLNVIMRGLSAVNAGRPYSALDVDVVGDYWARFGTAIGTGRKIGVAVRIVDIETGAASDYLRFLVKQDAPGKDGGTGVSPVL